ncbi:uncharacterized protein LOC108625406 isoform X1 [Ceratina calcarata]|uniref:Odorant receptor n=1 Tax=Ceratina calcarata TaxID=156304 RepID=A0AAJ7S3B2_9HYME|nr:uncharacterized protein LOC108625406 isoform X1 [Ceratina calcarata]
MFQTATPDKAIAFTQHCVALTCCWPPPLGATRSQILLYKVLRIMGLVNGLVLLVPLLYALHVYRNDTEILTKAAVMVAGIAQVLSQTTLCATQYDRYQRLIEHMRLYCKAANLSERQILQEYVDKYAAFYGSSATWFYVSALSVIFGTLFVSDPFPTNAEYPFSVDFEPLKSIIFIHQAVAGMQCAAHLSMNVFCALLLLFAAARFQILAAEMVDVDGIRSLVKCVKKYRIVRGRRGFRYAIEAARGMRVVVMVTYTFVIMSCVFSGVTIIGGASFTVKMQSFLLLGAGLLEAFMCALPADHLMEMSERVMQGAYESKWYMRPLDVQKCLLFMTIPRPPVVLSIKCIMPALSLNYFCSFVSNIFSIFTALRVTLMRDEED